jgi:ABC-type sugar transport system permease subunit
MATDQPAPNKIKKLAPVFEGSVISTILRLVGLAIVDAFALWFVIELIGDEEWILAGFITVITLGINAAFLIDGLYPYRWFSPGLMLLILMIVYPTVFTVFVAFTNYKDGNLLTRSQVEDQLTSDLYVYLPEDAPTFSWTAFRSTETASEFSLWLIPDSDVGSGPIFAKEGEVTPAGEVDLGQYELDENGIPTGVPGYERLEQNQVARLLDTTLSKIQFGEPGQIIKLSPTQPLKQAGVFRHKYSFDGDGKLIDNETGVVYKAKQGTYTPIDGPYVGTGGQVALEVKPFEPLEQYTVNPDGTVLDKTTDVLYAVNEDGVLAPIKGPFMDSEGHVTIDATVVEPLTQYTLNDDGTLLDNETGVVYAANDAGVFEPITGPFADAEGNPAFGGKVVDPLARFTLNDDGTVLDHNKGVVYTANAAGVLVPLTPFTPQPDSTVLESETGVVYAAPNTRTIGQLLGVEGGLEALANGFLFPVDGPLVDEEGRVLNADGEVMGPLAQYTLREDGLYDNDIGLLYASQDGEFVPVKGPDKEPLGRYTFNLAESTLFDTKDEVFYQANEDGEFVPVDGPFTDAEGRVAIDATPAEPLTGYTLQTDGTLLENARKVVFSAEQGLFVPQGEFTDSQGNVAVGGEIVEPLTRYTVNEDGTLYDNKTAVRFEVVDGTFTPVEGPFMDETGQVLEAETVDVVRPGYYVVTGLDNFKRLIRNERIRDPFLRVFIWTIAHAFFTVFLTFSLGLFLAVVLNAEFTPGRAFLRTALLVPYAIPAFISVLVWKGLLNEQLGVVNKMLESLPFVDNGPRWTSSPSWVKVGILLIQLWLGFPYMLLITSGALQSIPKDIYEAARVDGANVYQQFRHLTLPLLLVAVGPLLIASFAFNFNNFTIVELFNEGKPPISPDTAAGHSDILITYTYELAFGSGRGADYGFASTISLVIFALVAVITVINFRFTQSWEEISENV